MKPKLFVAMKGFVEYEDKVLLLQESSQYVDGTQQGKFDVVGGRVTPGEHFEESFLREIEEETGLSVSIGKPFYVNEVRPIVRGEDWQIIRVFFHCVAASDAVVLSQDHDAYKWIDPAEYRSCSVVDNLFSAFDAYLADRNT